jgi:hypothetical protein
MGPDGKQHMAQTAPEASRENSPALQRRVKRKEIDRIPEGRLKPQSL